MILNSCDVAQTHIFLLIPKDFLVQVMTYSLVNSLIYVFHENTSCHAALHNVGLIHYHNFCLCFIWAISLLFLLSLQLRR